METIKTILIAALTAALVNTLYIPEISVFSRILGNVTLFLLVYALVNELQEKSQRYRKAR